MKNKKRILWSGIAFSVLCGLVAFSFDCGASMKVSEAATREALVVGAAVSYTTPRLSSSLARATVSDEASTDVSLDVLFGDKEVSLEKKKNIKTGNDKTPYVVLKLVTVTRSQEDPRQRIELRAILEGADADKASLPYAIAWLSGNTDPTGSVRALGYQLTIRREHERPCTAQLPYQTCVNIARQIATLIDATFVFGSPEERTRFRQDATAMGIAPECSSGGPVNTQ